MYDEYARCRKCGHVERGDDPQIVQDEMADHKRREH